MLNRPIFFTQPIYLTLPDPVGVRTDFDEQPRLENAMILGLQAFTADEMALSPEGKAIIAGADIAVPLITLKVGSEERFQNIPYSQLVATTQAGAVMQLAGPLINWSKSYAMVPQGSVITLPCTLSLLAHYVPVELWKQLTPEQQWAIRCGYGDPYSMQG